MRHRLGDVELIAKLQRGEPVGVPDGGAIFERYIVEAPLEFGELVAGLLHFGPDAIDAATLLHGRRHLLPQNGMALAAALLVAQRHRLGGARLGLIQQLAGLRGRRALRELDRFVAGDMAENKQFRERIRAEPVRAVDADARTFARREKAGERRGRAYVRGNAAHGVMHGRPDGDRRHRRIDVHEFSGEFADERQPLLQLGAPEMAQIEIDGLAARRRHRAPLALLVPEGLAEAVARAELHRLVAGLRRDGSEPVILQIAVAVLVQQDSRLRRGRPR